MSLTCVTLHRQAVTMPHEVRDPRPADGMAQAAVLVAEIAERLDELEHLKKGLAGDLINRLSCIATASRRSFSITVQLLHGDYSEVLASYQEQASARGVTKQDIHHEFTTELAKLKRLYPLLHDVIQSTRRQAMNHEDPQASGEVARAGTVEAGE